MSNAKLPPYGGQALIEGVMMRGTRVAAMAVRAPDQQIALRTQPLGVVYRHPLLRLPFLRAVVGIWDALGLGWQSLNYSASVATGEAIKPNDPVSWISLLLAFAIGIGLFMVAPAAAGQWLEVSGGLNPWVSNLLEGLIRLAFIVAYIGLIGLIPDIRRVYAYHGAEHKTINAFEAGADMNLAAVRRFPLAHPRCGTAFLLTVVVFSIVVFALLGPLPTAVRLISRILLIPVIAGLAYEYQRFMAARIGRPLVRWLLAPSLLLQRLTTREPDDSMLEVALAAFQAMRAGETAPLAVSP